MLRKNATGKEKTEREMDANKALTFFSFET